MSKWNELKELATGLPAPWHTDADEPNTWHPKIRYAGDDGEFCGPVAEVYSNLNLAASDPRMHLQMKQLAKFIAAANPAAILELIAENERLREQCELNDLVQGTKGRERVAALFAEYGRMADQVSALEEKVTELNFDAARYCYLATTTWSDEVTDALCTSDKDQIDQAIDAELMRASA